MNNIFWLYLYILAVHWFADFVCQTHWQATNKSKNIIALTRHVLSYTGVLAVASLAIFGPTLYWFLFWGFNGLFHYATDFYTSQWSARLYAKKDWHNFFVIIGFDQLIHQSTLAYLLYYFWRF